jgi:hypothetical protein
MNIFKTNPCPITSAREACNKLVIKMPTESVQILACKFSLEQLKFAPPNKDNSARKHFNPKHGSVRWALESYGNYRWLIEHALALCDEYSKRYKKIHFQTKFINWAANNVSYSDFQIKELTPIYLAMPDKYKKYSKDYLCYQDYINGEKLHYSRWPSLEKIPEWFANKNIDYIDKNFHNGVYKL